MEFTALHRALGLPPGPISNDMLDLAVEQGVRETDDLDWKARLPDSGSLAAGDFPKDIAAMANSGGGIIVYGVKESGKAATERVDVTDFGERRESGLRAVAVSAISPPVFGLRIYELGEEPNRAVAVVIPATEDGPHLVYRNDLFGAPVRNDADTAWMKERQIETMYRLGSRLAVLQVTTSRGSIKEPRTLSRPTSDTGPGSSVWLDPERWRRR